jgi:hypothetical protein
MCSHTCQGPGALSSTTLAHLLLKPRLVILNTRHPNLPLHKHHFLSSGYVLISPFQRPPQPVPHRPFSLSFPYFICPIRLKHSSYHSHTGDFEQAVWPSRSSDSFCSSLSSRISLNSNRTPEAQSGINYRAYNLFRLILPCYHLIFF